MVVLLLKKGFGQYHINSPDVPNAHQLSSAPMGIHVYITYYTYIHLYITIICIYIYIYIYKSNNKHAPAQQRAHGSVVVPAEAARCAKTDPVTLVGD